MATKRSTATAGRRGVPGTGPTRGSLRCRPLGEPLCRVFIEDRRTNRSRVLAYLIGINTRLPLVPFASVTVGRIRRCNSVAEKSAGALMSRSIEEIVRRLAQLAEYDINARLRRRAAGKYSPVGVHHGIHVEPVAGVAAAGCFQRARIVKRPSPVIGGFDRRLVQIPGIPVAAEVFRSQWIECDDFRGDIHSGLYGRVVPTDVEWLGDADFIHSEETSLFDGGWNFVTVMLERQELPGDGREPGLMTAAGLNEFSKVLVDDIQPAVATIAAVCGLGGAIDGDDQVIQAAGDVGVGVEPIHGEAGRQHGLGEIALGHADVIRRLHVEERLAVVAKDGMNGEWAKPLQVIFHIIGRQHTLRPIE